MTKDKKKKRVLVKSNNPLAQIRHDALEEMKQKRGTHTSTLGVNADKEDSTPRCVAVRRGRLGRFAKELVVDLRRIMAPNTPMNLREKRSNTVKDYVAVAGVLGLSHIMTVTQTNSGPNLNLARLPRGPGLNFKILKFSPCSFLRKTAKKSAGDNSKIAFAHSPLVVLNNFDNAEHPRHVKIVGTTIQAMFPAINVRTVKLNECRRVLLVNYDEEEDTFSFRHYMIRADPQGASRSVRKLLKSKIPDLGSRVDVSEIVEANIRFGDDGGMTSDSEAEDATAAVALPQDFPGKGNRAGKKSVVKLREIGPRMTLDLIKVQEGVFDGEVLYHKYQSRSESEIQAQRDSLTEKRKLAEERRAEQERNVAKKRAAEDEKVAHKKARLEARKVRVLEQAQELEGGEEAVALAKKVEQDARERRRELTGGAEGDESSVEFDDDDEDADEENVNEEEDVDEIEHEASEDEEEGEDE